MDVRPARYCADCQRPISYANWSRHLRTHREYGGAAQPSRRRGSSVGSSTTTVPYTDTTRHRARRRRRAFVVAPAARACARRASELFAWGASLSTVRCRIQAQFRYIPCDIREASLVAAQEVLRVIRRRTDPCPPDLYYGSPLVSRRISFRARTSESQGERADVSDMSTTTSPSPVIPPSGRATILLGNESTVVEATQEIPLIIDVPESEDVFA